MKKIHKIFAIICACIMTMTATGCNNDQPNTPNDNSNTSNNEQDNNLNQSFAEYLNEVITTEYSNDLLRPAEQVDEETRNKLATATPSDLLTYEPYEGGYSCQLLPDESYSILDDPIDIVAVPAEYNGKPVVDFRAAMDFNWLVLDPKCISNFNLSKTFDSAKEGVYCNGVIYSFDELSMILDKGCDPQLYREDGLYLIDDGKTVLCYDPYLDMAGEPYAVDIPEGVETISTEAFRHSPIYYVKFPSTLKTIESKALSIYYGTELTLPDGLQTIGENAFSSGYFIANPLVIPDSVTEIGIDAFSDCDDIPELTIGKGITLIDGSFNEMESLTKVTIPSNVKIIRQLSFSECENLESVIFEEGCEIVDEAFYDCPNLKEVKLPSTLKKLDIQAFSGDESLDELTIPDSAYVYTSRSKVNVDDFNPNLKVIYRGITYTAETFDKMLEVSEAEVGEPLI